ncbi:MAG: hypothetical protein AB1705_11480 [Verrucomicrobiota bacterium]
METVLYVLARAVIAVLQALPLRVVARVGRALGALAYLLDARHRRVALRNLERCFGKEKSAEELHALAKENFRRIGENFACAAKTASMSAAEIDEVLEMAGTDVFRRYAPADAGQKVTLIFAVGHFGNFELYGRVSVREHGLKSATTYRGLRQPSLNRLLQSLREHSGCLFFERRTQGAELRAALAEGGLALGLLADQHAGDRGLRLPFFGEDCSTSAAPAVFALRYHGPLHVSVCYRVALARWRIEFTDEIPTHENGRPRSVEAIMLDVNRAFEAAIRRDPANWFWVHNRWKPGKYRAQPEPTGQTAEPEPIE